MTNELTTTTPVETPVNTINYNPVFPTMFAEVLLDLPVEDMVQDILQLAVDTKNYEGGYTTRYNRQNIDHVRGVPALKEAIYGVVCAYTRELKLEVNVEKCSINVWANVMRKGGHQTLQCYPLTQFAGMFLVKCSEASSPVMFQNPTLAYRMHEPTPMRPEDYTPFNSPVLSLRPKTGSLMVWPSWVNHAIPEVTEDAPHITLSFTVDFLPQGA